MSLLNLGAFSLSDFCNEMTGLIRIVGWVLTVFKIVIPLVIVGFGVFDFGKAVVSDKEDDIKKQTKKLVYRIIGGIAIYLLPQIILWLFGAFVDEFKQEETNIERCRTCLLNPGDCN